MVVAGSAIGLGNFLRFSSKAASNGGGFGHGAALGIFHCLWQKNRFILNIAVIYYGIKGGMERLCKVELPLLFIFGFMLMIRVLTLGTPDFTNLTWNVSSGFGVFRR